MGQGKGTTEAARSTRSREKRKPAQAVRKEVVLKSQPFYASRSLALVAFFAVTACMGSRTPPFSGIPSPESKHATTGQRMYVAENNQTVQIYSYPDGIHLGQVSGFGWVPSDCADTKGDIFAVDYGKARILEYAPGGTTPIAVLSDAGYSPEGCSVDPTTGNLAVTNMYASNYTSGTIAIYALAHHVAVPKLLTDPMIFTPRYCGYDASGNLYINGYTTSLDIQYNVLPAHSTQFADLSINQEIYEPSGIQWDGRYLAVGDQYTRLIYQFHIVGDTGTEVGSTSLGGLKYELNQFWIVGADVVAVSSEDGKVGIWKYPAGGRALKIIHQRRYGPLGVAVSSP
jgi:hypothetical protein